jgi:hypothetical protein
MHTVWDTKQAFQNQVLGEAPLTQKSMTSTLLCGFCLVVSKSLISKDNPVFIKRTYLSVTII